MNIFKNLSKFKLNTTFFYNTLFIDILLRSLILLLITLIFNFCLTEVIYCDSISEVIADKIDPVFEGECVSHDNEILGKTNLESSPSLFLKYKLIIRRKLY